MTVRFCDRGVNAPAPTRAGSPRPPVCYPRASMPVRLVAHPVIEDSLARLRDRETPCDEFRRLARRVSLVLVTEATRDLALTAGEVDTPLERTVVRRIASRVVAVPVLRAGLGMLEAFLELVPQAHVGYFGLERNEETEIGRAHV